MATQFERIFKEANTDSVTVTVDQIGNRPCSNIDPKKEAQLLELVRPIIEEVIQKPVVVKSASTDCNIPLSLGIPAVCIGVYTGGGVHTREEWVRKDSLEPGLEIAIRVANQLAAKC